MPKKNIRWIKLRMRLRGQSVLHQTDFAQDLHEFNVRYRKNWSPADWVIYNDICEKESSLVNSHTLIEKNIVQHDPGTAGDAAEEAWAEVLRSVLPRHHVVVKGVISDEGPNAGLSPQIDILVLKSDYPSDLLGKKIYPITAVKAAFECKLTLRLEHLNKAIQTANLLKNFLSRNGDFLTRIPIFYGVLALSSGIANKEKNDVTSVLDSIRKHSFIMNDTLNLLDLIVVPQKFCLAGRRSISFQDIDEPLMDALFMRIYEVLGGDQENETPSDSALGLFVQKLLLHLEKDDNNLQYTRAIYDLFSRYPREKVEIYSRPLRDLISPRDIKGLSKHHFKRNVSDFEIIE